MANTYIRIGVEIDTQNGLFSRLGAEWKTLNDATEIPIENGTLTYPDGRVKRFRIYISTDEKANWYYRDYVATAMKKANVSYAIIFPSTTDQVIVIATFTTDAASITNAQLESGAVASSLICEKDSNRILISTPYKPRQLYGRNAIYIGNSSDDAVTAFAANTKAISQGQFGQYPLYVFCANSIWAMEVGEGDVAFRSSAPTAINTSILGPDAVTNIDAVIVYATKDGIHQLPDKDDVPVSLPIQNSGTELDLLPLLNEKTALGYYRDSLTGRDELWVSTTVTTAATTTLKTFCFSRQHAKWFTMSEAIDRFVRVRERLMRLRAGVLYKDASTRPEGSYALVPLTMDAPDTLKRFRRVIAHMGAGDALLATNRTKVDGTLLTGATQFALPVTGTVAPTDAPLYSLDVEYETRYQHRTPSVVKLGLFTLSTPEGITRTPNRFQYQYDEEVTLEAPPVEGSTFMGWAGDASGTENPTTVVIKRNMTVTANYTEDAGPS